MAGEVITSLRTVDCLTDFFAVAMKMIPTLAALCCTAVFLNASVNALPVRTSLDRQCVLSAQQYMFRHFKKATVRFRNGTRTEALVNYHYLDGQLRFLNPGGDTLVFTAKYLIDRVEASGRTFLLTENLDMEVIAVSGRFQLAMSVRPEARGTRLSHSGQQFSASMGNTVPGSLMVTNQDGQFQWQNNAPGHDWGVKTSFFLIDQNKITHRASRRSFMKVFSRERRRVARFIRENRVDFRREADLQTLLVFCGGLPVP